MRVSCTKSPKAKRKEWQCDEEVQKVEEKLWKIEELRRLEEALPRLKECHLEKVSRLYNAKTGVGVTASTTRFLWT